ncbi:YfdX family protein, partial [Methylobacterium sp. E-005]|uniref:YfdX family protein n=1 Tax=Methylobacterium sp. E-005 TaxID=2836549 RepID=UPI001FB9AF76
LPLNKTIADVDQAATLIGQGKYYEANAILKTAQDGMRFDVIDAVALPQTGKAAAGTTGSPMATGTAAGAKTGK